MRRQIEAGIDFLVPCGTTGESPTLTRDEHLRVVEITLEEAKGKVPVLAGAGGYNTREVIELARELERMGVDGILSVTPYYNKPTQEGLYPALSKPSPAPSACRSWFTACRAAPASTSSPPRWRAWPQIENIVGVKEASGNIAQMANVMHQVPADFTVLSGDDAITMPLIALGGRGIISVVSNEIPGRMTQLAQACLRGDFAAARADPAPLSAADERQLRRSRTRFR